jgi:hypothetical protein
MQPALSTQQEPPPLEQHERLREAVLNMTRRGHGLEYVVKITGLPGSVAERYMRDARKALAEKK